MANNFLSPFQLLELNLISAQDLASVSRKMRTYAVAWVHPERKLSTRVDTQGHNNPTWNDKFVFRVDNEFLHGETSAVMIEIYAIHWFRDVHVGTVRILVENLFPPTTLRNNKHTAKSGTRFVALQVRRASGRPQGILNIGVAILDSSMRSMPLYTQLSASAVGFRDLVGDASPMKNDETGSSKNNQFLLPWSPKPELRRVKSDSSSLLRPVRLKTSKSKASSMINGSEIVNTKRTRRSRKAKVDEPKISVSTSMITDSTVSSVQRGTLTLARKSDSQNIAKKLESEIGPSVSEVATTVMVRKKKQNDAVDEESDELLEDWSLESSMEGLRSKLERWRSELPAAYDRSDLDAPNSSIVNFGKNHRRRRTDGGGGFSCYGKICGLEISIVCGGESAKRKPKPNKRSESADSSSFL